MVNNSKLVVVKETQFVQEKVDFICTLDHGSLNRAVWSQPNYRDNPDIWG